MLLLIFCILMPFVLFLILYIFSAIVIFLINKIFNKKYPKSLSFILPCFFVVFCFMLIMGGISFKYIDPQYYEFKRLCKTQAKRNVFDRDLYKTYKLDEIYSNRYPNKQINSRITKMYFENIHKPSNKVFYEYETYFYDNYGIFIYGDEAAGLNVNFTYKVLDCEPKILYKDQ